MPSLKETFDIKNDYSDAVIENDYEIFKDKELLDALRSIIIEKIIEMPNKNEKAIVNIIDETIENYDLTNQERAYIINLIQNELTIYGPLINLINNDHVTEIMVNSPSEIYVEIDGQIYRDYSVSFINNDHILRTIRRLIESSGKTIDTNNPMVDSRLPNGARLNAIIEPLSLRGPVLTIRKFQKEMSSIEDLIRTGTLTSDMALFLEACVKAKLNIIICGPSGAGKTTLLNILGDFIDPGERVITIEDACEIQLKSPHVVSLETRTSNYQKEGEVTIRDLVINSLRMRPDRIIVGEVRGKEAFDMLQAMNTGHDGSITTMHANNPTDAINRLEAMVIMGVDIPVRAIREYIDQAVDIIIKIERLSDGKRKITSISEVSGIENDSILIKDIYHYEILGKFEDGSIDGKFVIKPKAPDVLTKINSKGINDINKLFKK